MNERQPSPVSDDGAAQRMTAGYDVVLLVGQSNMGGYGWGYDPLLDGVQDARIHQWSRSGSPVATSETLQQADWGRGSTRVGMGTSIARNDHFDAPAMPAYGHRYFDTLDQAIERR